MEVCLAKHFFIWKFIMTKRYDSGQIYGIPQVDWLKLQVRLVHKSLVLRGQHWFVMYRDQWMFRRCRDTQMWDIIHMVERHQLAEDRQSQDVVLCRNSTTEFSEHFSTLETWQQLYMRRPVTGWSKVVWFSLGVLRFTFITWLAVRYSFSRGSYTCLGASSRMPLLWRTKWVKWPIVFCLPIYFYALGQSSRHSIEKRPWAWLGKHTWPLNNKGVWSSALKSSANGVSIYNIHDLEGEVWQEASKEVETV